MVSHRTDASAPPPLMGTSLWLLREDALLRLWLYDAVTSPAFDYVMTALILLNCVAMAYEHPRMDPEALDSRILYWRWAPLAGPAHRAGPACLTRVMQGCSKPRDRACLLQSAMCSTHEWPPASNTTNSFFAIIAATLASP